MSKENLKIYDTPKLTAEAFGDYLMQQASERPVYHCALSGGSTPKLLFDYLAVAYKDSPLWGRIHLYWGDERCVPPTDEESNYKMTKDRLLDHVDIPAANVHPVLGEDPPAGEAVRYGQELADHMTVEDGKPLFDMIILGMGEDGHTASIFPHQMELLTSPEVCTVATHPDSGQQRVTLTGPVINAAHEVAFLVTGQGKQGKIAEIIGHSGQWELYPASHIFPQGKLLWFMDQAAAGGL